jgi:hypothetical protein
MLNYRIVRNLLRTIIVIITLQLWADCDFEILSARYITGIGSLMEVFLLIMDKSLTQKGVVIDNSLFKFALFLVNYG